MPFLNTVRVPQLMRRSLKKGSLRIGRYNSGYLIVTDKVFIWCADKEIHPKIKAIVAELLEFLPDHQPDCLYQVSVKEEPKLVEDPTKIFNCLNLQFAIQEDFTLTPVFLTERGYTTRLLQDTRNGKLRGTLSEHLDLVDRKLLDYDIEGDPAGPFSNLEKTLLFYTNGTTTLGFVPHIYESDQSKETLNLLSMVDYKFQVD